MITTGQRVSEEATDKQGHRARRRASALTSRSRSASTRRACPIPRWRPRKALQVVVPRPGVAAKVEIGLVGAGDIEGMLVQDDGGGFEGLDVELLDAAGKVVATTRSDYRRLLPVRTGRLRRATRLRLTDGFGQGGRRRSRRSPSRSKSAPTRPSSGWARSGSRRPLGSPAPNQPAEPTSEPALTKSRLRTTSCSLRSTERQPPDYIHWTKWCGREDSNFHGLSPTTTSTLRVYQFRHDRTREKAAHQLWGAALGRARPLAKRTSAGNGATIGPIRDNGKQAVNHSARS